MAKQTGKTKKYRNSRNGRGDYRKRENDTRNSRGMEREVDHKYNDVSWYAKNEYMLRDAASLPFSYRVGDIISDPLRATTQRGPGADGLTTTDRFDGSIPGLMRFGFTPTIGVSIDASSPANLAAQNIYSYVRYMNSGAKNYDQADLMLYLMAMDSVYMLWNWIKRMYGYIRTYSVRNAYMPRAFAIAEGLDFDDAIANLADYRMQLNSLAAQISSFCVPAVMPIMVRHSWMASNIYKDSDTEKAQMYMYSPYGYHQYDETGSKYGGQLVFKTTGITLTTNLHTMGTYIGYLKEAIDAIAYSEDVGVMSGDILKAYGQEKLFKISPLEPDYMVVPVYNEEVLNQLHNLTLIENYGTYKETDSTLGDKNITQDPNTGFLRWNPNFITQGTANNILLPGKSVMLNMPWDNPTPANVMVGSRLAVTVTFHNPTSGQKYWNLDSCGSEIIENGAIIFYKKTTPPSLEKNTFHQYLSTGTEGDILDIQRITQFDWHPLLTPYHEGNSNVSIYGKIGDINNYTFVDSNTLSKLHQTALLSEFNVPQIGSF